MLRLQKWNDPWPVFWHRHVELLTQTARMVQHKTLHPSPRQAQQSPWPYMFRTTVFITLSLTVAGSSWYIAVNMTTASDLTAIYNCSAFFAYAFSVPLLGEKLRVSKVVSVAIAILGVLIVAYGGSAHTPKHGSKSGGGAGGPDHDTSDENNEHPYQFIGNVIIGVGSVMYGFYEVLYKKAACPPEDCSPGRGMIFANAVGSMIGCFTLSVLWIPLPILHFTGIEIFELPRGEAATMMFISVLSNVVFSGSFLVLISLTSPVLSSVAALLTIFIVALIDQLLPPPLNAPLSGAAIVGGTLIIGAFIMLSWATYKEMEEERRKASLDAVEESDIDD
jgi:drug/metabolite transporter (DMT)-like permease